MGATNYSQGSIKRSLQIYISFKFVNLLLAFIFQVALAKILSPANFATYAVLLATLMAGERALSLGIDRTILRFVPALTRENDLAGVRALILRVALMRAAALATFVVVYLIGAPSLNSILPIQLGQSALFAFAVWFVAYTSSIDVDAFAQSCLAHYNSALGAMLEIIFRTAALFVLSWSGNLNVENIVAICAVTSSISVIFIVYRLSKYIKPLLTKTITVSSRSDMTFEPARAPIFALANFTSTMSYLISSPSVVRIVATGGLDVITLAAFSFSQGLYISVQRVFPGLLILPTLEPIVMSRVAGDVRGDRIAAALSLLFKAELACIMSVLIVTSIAGADVVAILSRPIYASYYYVLPILVGSVALITSYRLFELIANTNFKQHIFFWLWPLSAIAIFAMYTTVRSWGLLSVLIWPIAEICVRIALLTLLLRRYAVWRTFDLGRSILIILSAACIIILLFVLRWLAPMNFRHSDLILAGLGLISFLASFFVVRPLRLPEYEALVTATPASWAVVRGIALRASRATFMET